MKVLILLFFTFNLPIFIFLSVILYGGIDNRVLKEELAKSSIYVKINGLVDTFGSNNVEDPQSEQFISVIRGRLTSSFIKNKTEEIIDDSYVWITYKSTTPPVASFKELKEDFLAKNPELLTSLQSLPEESQNYQVGSDPQEQINQVHKGISNFVKSDFSFPLEKNLTGIKQVYGIIKIAQPILGILLIISLAFLGVLNTTWHKRLRWLSAAFISAAIWGYIHIASNTLLVSSVVAITQSTTNEFANIASPIVVALIKRFAASYIHFQGIVGIGMLITAAILLVVGELANRPLKSSITSKKK